jgi:preprotein translocase subunit SecE
MTDEIKIPDAGAADKVKAGTAVLLVIAGIAGYYALAGDATWMRWLAVAAGLVLAVVVVAFSRYGHEFRQFVELARVELRKIVWPNRQETGMTTLVVLVFVIVAGIFFWLLDLALAWATKAITGTGG